MSNDELPLGIFLLAALQGLQALGLLLVGGLWLLIPILGLFIAIPYGIAGFFGLFIAFGLFTLQEYAWFWSFVLNIVGTILFLAGSNLIGIIISVIILIYLNIPDVRSRFS